MVDVTNLMGDTITIDVVKDSTTKSAVILSAGTVEEYDTKKKLKMLVEMEGRQIFYIPNKTSLKSISKVLGKESEKWIGKVLNFTVGMVNGKDAVLSEVKEN